MISATKCHDLARLPLGRSDSYERITPATDRELLAFARAVAAEAEGAAERRAITFSDLMTRHLIAMQAAVIDAQLDSPEKGMQWIVNTLFGPGLLPDLEEARAMGGAQAWFDAAVEKHEAFRAAHPGPAEAKAG